jgi:hypothetical protein
MAITMCAATSGRTWGLIIMIAKFSCFFNNGITLEAFPEWSSEEFTNV